MDQFLQVLRDLTAQGTPNESPAYIYDGPGLDARLDQILGLFGDAFTVSYAIKANPNAALLARIAGRTGHLDASSYAEVRRGLQAGVAASRISYSGPGKRMRELRAILGLGVELVVEALDEIALIGALASAAGVVQPVVLRINPDFIPKGFGAKMSQKPSQFGIDEEKLADAVQAVEAQTGLELIGFHIYAGSNCLSSVAIVENIANMARLFGQAAELAGRAPRKLIFGAGFGVPYHDGQTGLDVAAVREGLAPVLAALEQDPVLRGAEKVLEMGRWIIGPCGALVAEVLSRKESRGMNIAVCDAGFNTHLAACGMMGSVFQKNYPIYNLSRPWGEEQTYLLAGPLCTSIDTLARNITLPRLDRGDRLAVGMSGAYGLTASSTRFISHPEAHEYFWNGETLVDITESAMNSFSVAPREAALDGQ